MNGRVVFLLAVAAALFLWALSKGNAAAGSPKFVVGSRVQLVANPAVHGTVTGVIYIQGQGWSYNVQWDTGERSFNLGERFLQSFIGPAPGF